RVGGGEWREPEGCVGNDGEAMAGLSDEQRLAVALTYQDGFTLAGIFVVAEVQLGTVKTRLMHARRKLADQLSPDRN
ncbi:sigma factor-like helix-turn-helix DNA-binding protein, partial [uncultured Maricaulis sp.]|uniref:RNA polymerase sigma factor n=1 Tax=uncultured Maricaulis sp. TaxID=174710 RepID=UPI0030D9CE38